MSTMMTLDKTADLAGPGIGNYEELAGVLPDDYNSLLDPKQTQEAITLVKRYIEANLCRELKLMRERMGQAPRSEGGEDLPDERPPHY